MSNETPQSPQDPDDVSPAETEPAELDDTAALEVVTPEEPAVQDAPEGHGSDTAAPGPAAEPEPDSEVESEVVRVDGVPVDVGEPAPAVEAPEASEDAATGSEGGADAETTEYDAVVAVEYDEVAFEDLPDRPRESDAVPATQQTDAYPPAGAFLAGTATAAVATADTASASRAPAGFAPGPVAPIPVYVTAPTPPKAKGNRMMGILIAVVAAVAYAVVFAVVTLGIFALRDVHGSFSLWENYLQTAGFWAPVIVFFLAYVLLIAIVNRGGWWAYGIGSFFVAVIVYFGYLGGALITVSAWKLNSGQVGQFVGTLWSSPLTFASAVVALEASLWFGAWIAARGRSVRRRNLEAQRDYDRRIQEGPTA